MPEGLREAIEYIFDQDISDTTLVGGTALSGYYAGHRQSDDIDLFVRDETSFRATCLAVDSLVGIGATKLQQLQKSKQLYKALYLHRQHEFTIDIVIDSSFHSVADSHKIDSAQVASLLDILRMKMATLVSRCSEKSSEKDLYDLIWLFTHFKDLSLKEKIELGNNIDAGLTAQNALAVLSSTKIRKEACGFCSGLKDGAKPPKSVYEEIQSFRKQLIQQLIELSKQAPSATGIDKIKKSLK